MVALETCRGHAHCELMQFISLCVQHSDVPIKLRLLCNEAVELWSFIFVALLRASVSAIDAQVRTLEMSEIIQHHRRMGLTVTYELASLDKKVTAPMRSSGRPILPTGIREVHCFWRSGLSSRIFLVLPNVNAAVPPGQA